MMPGGEGSTDFDGGTAVGQNHILCMFNHDDAVGPGWQWLPGVDGLGGTDIGGVIVGCQGERDGIGFAGIDGVLSAQGIAIHGAGMVVGRGEFGPNGCRGNTAVGLSDRDSFGGQGLVEGVGLENGREAVPGCLEGHIFQVNIAFHLTILMVL